MIHSGHPSANVKSRLTANTSHSTRKISPKIVTWYTFTLITIINIRNKKQDRETKFRSDLTSAPLVRDSGTFVFFTEDVSFSMSLALGYYDDDADDKMAVLDIL